MGPLRYLQGWTSAHVAYPLAERLQKRDIRPKRAEMRAHYQKPFPDRRRIAAVRLADNVRFAGERVPYYRDLLRSIGFDVAKLDRDPRYVTDIPPLTKEIIREQGERLLSQPLSSVGRHYPMKTGGSTGQSAVIYYDQIAADYAAAVVLFCRETIGKAKHKFEVHFASRVAESPIRRDRWRERAKCFAMNRSNIFFDALDDPALKEIARRLRRLHASMVHAHPSTMYALACYLRKNASRANLFEVFESSGELLEPYQRREIADTMRCRVVDRYGLAELGVVGYQTVAAEDALLVLDSEAWPETLPSEADGASSELVFTSFRNRLMPLIRYRTGDLGTLEERANGFWLSRLTGRIHDLVRLDGKIYPSHYIQDVLDRIGGIQEFQIDVRTTIPVLRIVAESGADIATIEARVKQWWRKGLEVRFVGHDGLVRVGDRAKFRRVITG